MSSLNVISVLSLFLTLNSIECQSKEMCQFVRPDGTYEGMGLHKEYKSGGKSDTFLSNKRSVQWKFELSEDHKQLELLPGEYRIFDENVLLQFGIYVGGFINVSPSYLYANCYVDKRDTYLVRCFDNNDYESQALINESVVNLLIFRGYSYYNSKRHYSVILRRSDKTIFFLRTDLQEIKSKIPKFRSFTKFVDNCSPDDKCPDMRFIDQMNGSLILQLDGVVDYIFGQTNSGFLLLFNINGRPMYCFQNEGEDLTEECRTVENLISFYEECFKDEEVSTTTQSQQKDSTDPLVWVLIFELILMVILVIACNYVIGKRRKRNIRGPTNSVTSRSYHRSRDEQSARARVAALLNAT